MQYHFFNNLYRGLYGAWRLALGDRQALEVFDPRPAAAWQSFQALYLTVPLWFFMGYVQRAPYFEDAGFPLPEALVLTTLSQLIAHVSVFFVVFRICLETGRLHRFPVYVSIQNWASLFLALLLFGGGTLLNMLTSSELVLVPVMMAQLLYSYFITRVALNMAPLPAIGVCLAEFVITVIVNMGAAMVLFLSQAKAVPTP